MTAQQATLPLDDVRVTRPTRQQQRQAFERKAAEAIAPPLFRKPAEAEEPTQ